MQINDFKWILKCIQIFYISLAYYGFVRMYCATDQNTSFLVIKLRIYHMTFEKPEIFWGGQGWTIGLAHSPRQVSKSVGQVQITYHVCDNVASELFMINTCSPGKLKIEVIPFGFRKSLKRKRKKKTRKLLVIQRAQRSTRRTDRGSFQRNGKLAGHGCSMIRIRVWYASGA